MDLFHVKPSSSACVFPSDRWFNGDMDMEGWCITFMGQLPSSDICCLPKDPGEQ